MPFSDTEISNAGLAAINFFLKNKPVDQIAVERPWLKCLMETAKTFPGAQQHVVEQLRHTYGSNFQWYYGAQAVTYNSRQTMTQSFFTWRSAHDGFFLDEDRLLQNGITIDQSQRGGNNSEAERMQLVNLLDEQSDALRLGFEEKMDLELHLDGTQNTEALAGLDHVIQEDPTVSSQVGGINQNTNIWWRNQFNLGLTTGTILAGMETTWRFCTKNGGAPNKIIAGEVFIDTYKAAIRAAGQIQIAVTGTPKADGSLPVNGQDGLYFHGVPITWDPPLSDTGLTAPVGANRCYFLNMRHVRLRPAYGHDMITRKPPREYNRYVYYWALTWKGALTTNRRSAHAILGV